MKKKLIFIGVFFVSFFALIAGLALIADELISHKSSYQYFYEALDELPETNEIVVWTDEQPRGRALADNNRYDLAVKITESWQAYAMAMDQDNENLLKDYFTMTALERTRHVLDSAKEQQANMVMMGMTVEPAVYHIDGTMFQYRANDALFARFMIKDDVLEAYSLTEDCILSNMILRQSGWKIAHLERDCSKDVPIKATAKNWDLPVLKGINYYPKNSPWTGFWRDYDSSIVSQDIARMKALGANSVRIFLPLEEFTRSDISDDSAEYLQDFLAKSEAQGIYVIPTLFDFRGELTPQSWARDRYYLDQVLPIISEFSNIAYVDVKNELDLDEDYQSPALLEAWLMTIMGTARQIAPELSYSLGWSNAENALRFADLMDVISYHDYASVKDARENLAKVKAGAGGKPVIVSEIGETSYRFALGIPGSEKKQAQKLDARLQELDGADGVLVWTLYDYPALDPKAVGGSFWNKGIQKNFGLYSNLDAKKPVAAIFTEWSQK